MGLLGSGVPSHQLPWYWVVGMFSCWSMCWSIGVRSRGLVVIGFVLGC